MEFSDVIFNFKKWIDNKAFIFDRNAKNYQVQKVFIQNYCYRIPTLSNFYGFPLNTKIENSIGFLISLEKFPN
jgi:hypothetical protein